MAERFAPGAGGSRKRSKDWYSSDGLRGSRGDRPSATDGLPVYLDGEDSDDDSSDHQRDERGALVEKAAPEPHTREYAAYLAAAGSRYTREPDEEARTAAQFRKYLRPEAPPGGAYAAGLKAAGKPLDLFIVDLDSFNDRQSGSTFRLFGVTPEGHSICLFVEQFLPYFYFLPEGPLRDTLDLAASEPDGETLRVALAAIARGVSEATEPDRPRGRSPAVVSAELVRDKIGIYGYSEERRNFVLLRLREPKLVPPARDALSSGDLSLCGAPARSYARFEADVPYAVRFLLEKETSGSGWLRVQDPSAVRWTAERATRCQLEGRVSERLCSGNTGRTDTAPVRVLILDVECTTLVRRFPIAERDPTPCVVASVYSPDQGDRPICEALFCVGDVEPIGDGVEHVQFGSGNPLLEGTWPTEEGRFDDRSQARMLLALAQVMICDLDVDYIGGYNSDNFDLNNLLIRADTVGVGSAFRDFSRVLGEPCDNPPATFSSKAFGTRESLELRCPGRCTFDVLRMALRDLSLGLRSFTLNSVASKVLDQTKYALSHDKIAPCVCRLFSPETLQRTGRATGPLRESFGLPSNLQIYLAIQNSAAVPLVPHWC